MIWKLFLRGSLSRRLVWSFRSFWGIREKNSFLRGRGTKTGYFCHGGTVPTLLISWWAGGSVTTNRATDITEQSTINNHLTRIKSAEERLAGHVHTWRHELLKRKYLARRQTFIRLKYILNFIRNPILFYTLSVSCCFSLRTAQLTANFARQDPRISWCRFTKTKFNLISDRDAFLEIANGQQIPYNLVCL